MRTSFTVNDMTIHRIVEQEAGFTPILEFLPSLSRELLDENRSWMEPAALDPATGMAVLCFQSYVVKTPHHTILVDACIGNDKSFPHRPTWHRKSDSNWMQALQGRRRHRRRYRHRHVHASARRPCRLEHATGERPLGPDLSQCQISLLEKGIRILGRGPSRDPARPDEGQRSADHRRQKGRARHQRLCRRRPHPADPDPWPYTRSLCRLRRAQWRPGGVHRRPDPFADSGALPGSGDAGRLRSGAGGSRPGAGFSSATATPAPCAARCTSRRPRSGTSSAGATASAASRSAIRPARRPSRGHRPAAP